MPEYSSYAQQLVRQTAAELSAKALLLTKLDVELDNEFTLMLEQALKYSGLSLEGIAAEAGFSPPLIELWSRSRGLPQIQVRKRVASWIVNQLQLRAAALIAQLEGRPLTPLPKKKRDSKTR